MIPWPWLIVPLFVGVPLGAIVMGSLCRTGCSAREAIWHLRRLHRLLDEAGEIPIEGGAMDNARRFLDQYGEGEGV